MRLHVFAGENAILKFQACPKHLPLSQSCNSSNGQLTIGLSQSGLSYLYDQMMGIPNGSSIFKLRPDQGSIGSLSDT